MSILASKLGWGRAVGVLVLALAGALVGQTGTAFAAGTKAPRAAKSKPAPEAQKAPPTADLIAAKQAYEEALRAFNLGQWGEAIAGFQKSYKLSGDAALLFNVAQAQRQAGHVKEAIIAYKAFLRERPETPNRERIEAKIKDLESAAEAQTAAEKPETGPAQPDRLTGVWEDPFAQKPATPPASSPAAPMAPAPIAPPPPAPISGPSAAAATPPARPAVAESPLASPPAAASNQPAYPQPALDLRQKDASEEPAATSGSRWWLWTGIGAGIVVVAGAVGTAIWFSTRSPGRDSTCPSGLDGCIPVGK
jgi:tetratricopeptide (TPR) repeat protein